MNHRVLLVAVLSLTVPATAFGYGLVLSGVGAINRSMGGATVAAPLDATGALHWNPAAISGLSSSRMDIGMELLTLPTTLHSSVDANALGAGVPPVDLVGKTDGDGGVFPLPSMAMVVRPESCDWTYGLGVFTIGGFGVNYPGDPTNPVLMPPAPAGLGVGSLYSRLQVFQIAPTVAYQVTETLSLGLAPTITLAELQVNPATVASPDDANGDGFPSYPSGTQTRLHWGGGVQVGAYLELAKWNLGASFKSKQAFETFTYSSEDEVGAPRELTLDFEYPMIVSVGAAFTGVDGLTVAADGRWIDYENSKGFETAAYDETGAVTGLGWESVFAMGLGAHYEWESGASARLGYSYGQNPIPSKAAFFNIAAPSITEHIVYAGGSYRFSSNWALSITALHAFENSVEGPWVVPPNVAVPGTSVTTDLSVTGVSFELSSFF